MLIPPVRLAQPADLAGALALLAEHGDRARLLAGGTDLLVEMKSDLSHPELLVSLAGLVGLDEIEASDQGLRLGALVTVNRLARSAAVRERLPALAESAAEMASPQIRNMATLGGNICSAVPSADLPPSLIAADARVALRGPGGERQLALAEFFTGPRAHQLAPAEVLTHVVVDPLPPCTGVDYRKFSVREGNACTVAAVAARLTLSDGAISEARVVLGAVAPTPLLAATTGGLLVGQEPSAELFAAAAEAAAGEARPITDVRATADYRLELVRVLTRRALAAAHARAGGGPG